MVNQTANIGKFHYEYIGTSMKLSAEELCRLREGLHTLVEAVLKSNTELLAASDIDDHDKMICNEVDTEKLKDIDKLIAKVNRAIERCDIKITNIK